MPKYDYRCSICNIETEVEGSIHDDIAAPLCCGIPMSKVFGVVPIKFNVGGFYSTDNPKR